MVAPRAAIWASDRSTKMTPRSTTWTPRYAWMPVRIRLATNGAARNSRTLSSIALLRRRLFDRRHQQVDVVVEQLEVVARLRHAADRRRHHQDLAAGVGGNRVRGLQVEVRLDQDQLHVLRLHRVDHVEGVLRRRRDAGLGLD